MVARGTSTARREPRIGRRGLLAAMTAAGGAVLAACRRGAAKGAPRTAAPLAGQPRSGGTLNVAIAADMFNWDVTGNGKTIPNPNGTTLALESLLSFKQGPGLPYDQNVITSNLAQSWETPDATTYVFHLAKNVAYANLPPINGRPLTAADVKWAYQYHSRTGDPAFAKLPAANFSYMFDGLDSIQAPDATTVSVKFQRPYAPFLTYNFTFALPVYPHEVFDQYGNFNDHLVGSGPFQLDQAQSQHGTKWVFSKNPTYWQPGRPYLDAVHYLVLTDDSARSAAFIAGQTQILRVSDATSAAAIRKAALAALVEEGLDPQAYQMYINRRHPPFTDDRRRQALSLALDRDAFIQTFAGGKGGWIMADSLPGLWTDQEIKQILHHDPAQAKQMIAAAGYPNGLDVPLMLQTGSSLTQSAMQLFQAQMKTVGFNVGIQFVDGGNFSQKLHSGDFTLAPTTEQIFADLDSRLYGNFFSTSPSNWIGLKDPEVDRLILAQRSEVDPARRRDALRAVTRYMNENAISLGFYQTPQTTFMSPALKNYGDNWQQYNFDARDIWLTQ
jgi:peptide/nickel transport system substrate-binding protein